MNSGVGPGDGDLADLSIEPELLPDGGRGIHDVVLAAAVGVALVHDRGLHGFPGVLARDADLIVAPLPSRVPPRGQRHDEVVVAVEAAITRRRASAVFGLLEPGHRHHSKGAAAAATGYRKHEAAAAAGHRLWPMRPEAELG